MADFEEKITGPSLDPDEEQLANNAFIDYTSDNPTKRYTGSLKETRQLFQQNNFNNIDAKVEQTVHPNINSGDNVVADSSGIDTSEQESVVPPASNAPVTSYSGATEEVEETEDIDVDKQTQQISRLTEATGLPVGSLYKQVLGRTTYDDLKFKCGLAPEDSFTEYYSKTHYVPAGFEKEAKLLLAEEKRMSYYAQYEEGTLSRTDFLYKAYGKDLLKAQGYDLSSQNFWYNWYKEGNTGSPLDNPTTLSTLISNAEELFVAEKWYQDISSKTLSSALAGVVTGVELDQEKVYDLFKDTIDKLTEALNKDVSDIITMYQAGNLTGVFEPFIDIDGDNKFDYYYHTNGKMYAVEGSSGQGTSTCKLEYDSEGRPVKVEIKEGITGVFGSFVEGVVDFFGTLADLGAMMWSATFGNIGKDDYFVESYQQYMAGKQRVFSNQDVVVFQGHDMETEIARGIGMITGQVALQVAMAVLTAGAGNAALAAKDAALATVKGIAAGAAIGFGVGAAVEGIQANESGRDFDISNALSMGITGAVAGGTIVGGTAAVNAASTIKVADKATKLARGWQKFTGGMAKVLQFATKGNTGAIFDATKYATKLGGFGYYAARVGNAALLALKDGYQTGYNLTTANQILKYYEYSDEHYGTNYGFKSLTPSEIASRIAIASATDLVISSTLRLQGDEGFTSMIKMAKLDKEGRAVLNTLQGSTRSAVINAAKSTRGLLLCATTDNILDVVENLLTMGVSTAMNNPYAKVGSKESFETFAKSLVSPGSIIQNLYITARNFGVIGDSSTYVNRSAGQILSLISKGNQDLDTAKQLLMDKFVEQHSGDENFESRYSALKNVFADIDAIGTRPEDKGKSFYDISIEKYIAFSELFTDNSKQLLDDPLVKVFKEIYKDTASKNKVRDFSTEPTEDKDGNKINFDKEYIAASKELDKLAKKSKDPQEKAILQNPFFKLVFMNAQHNEVTSTIKMLKELQQRTQIVAKGRSMKLRQLFIRDVKPNGDKIDLLDEETRKNLHLDLKKFADHLAKGMEEQATASMIRQYQYESLLNEINNTYCVHGVDIERHFNAYYYSQSTGSYDAEGLNIFNELKDNPEASEKFKAFIGDNKDFIILNEKTALNNENVQANSYKIIQAILNYLTKLTVNDGKPVFDKFTVKVKTANNDNAERTYFVFAFDSPNTYGRLREQQNLNHLIDTLYAIYDVSNKTDADVTTDIINLGKMHSFFLNSDKLLENTQGGEVSDELYLMRGITYLLTFSDFDYSNKGEFTKDGGLTRQHLLALCKDFKKQGVITTELLDKILAEFNGKTSINSGLFELLKKTDTEFNPEYVNMFKKNINDLKEYLESFETVYKASETLRRIVLVSEDGKDFTLTRLDKQAISAAKKILDNKDNKFTKYMDVDKLYKDKVLMDIINDAEALRPFSEALETEKVSLVRSQSLTKLYEDVYSKDPNRAEAVTNLINNIIKEENNDYRNASINLANNFKRELYLANYGNIKTKYKEVKDTFNSALKGLKNKRAEVEKQILSDSKQLATDLLKQHESEVINKTLSTEDDTITHRIIPSNYSAALEKINSATKLDEIIDTIKSIEQYEYIDGRIVSADDILAELNKDLDDYLKDNADFLKVLKADINSTVGLEGEDLIGDNYTILTLFNFINNELKYLDESINNPDYKSSKQELYDQRNKLLALKETYNDLYKKGQAIYYARTKYISDKYLAYEAINSIFKNIKENINPYYKGDEYIKLKEAFDSEFTSKQNTKDVKDSYVQILSLSDTDIIDLFRNPESKLESLKEQKVSPVNNELNDVTKAIYNLKKQASLTADEEKELRSLQRTEKKLKSKLDYIERVFEKLTSDKLFNSPDNMLILSMQLLDSNIRSPRALVNEVNDVSKHSIVRDTIISMIKEYYKDFSNSDNYEIYINKSTGDASFNISGLIYAKNLSTNEEVPLNKILTNQQGLVRLILNNPDDTIADSVLDEVNKFERIRYDNTQTIERNNKVRVNFNILMPYRVTELLELIEQSQALRARSLKAQESAVIDKINKLETSGRGSLDYQLNVYSDNIINQNGTLQAEFDLDDPKLWRLLKNLGYTDKVIKNALNEPYDESRAIPGVYVQTQNSYGLKTELDFEEFRNKVYEGYKKTYTEANNSINDTDLDFITILDNAYRTITYLDEDSQIYSTDPLFGYFNAIDDNIEVSHGSIKSTEDLIKLGVAASSGNAANVLKNFGLRFSTKDTNDEHILKSRNSTRVIRLLNNINTYFNEPKLNPNQEYSETFKISTSWKTKEALENNINKALPARRAYSISINTKDMTMTVSYNPTAFKNMYDDIFSNDYDEFDITQFVPLLKENIKGVSLELDRSNTSQPTLIQWLSQYSDDDNVFWYDKTNLPIFSLNKNTYKSTVEKLHGKNNYFTVKQVLDNKALENSNNYYELALKNYIDSGLKYLEYIRNSVISEDLKSNVLFDSVSRTLLGETINNYLKNHTIDDLLTNEGLNDLIANYRDTISKADAANYFSKTKDNLSTISDEINTGSISNLNIKNKIDINDEELKTTLKEIVNQIKGHKSLYKSDKDKKIVLPKHNSYAALFSTLYEGDKGKLLINLQYLMRLTNADRELLLDILKQSTDQEAYNSLNEKIELLRSLHSLSDEANEKPVSLVYQSEVENAPTVNVGNGYTPYFSNYSKESQDLLIELEANRLDAKKPYKRFLNESSIYEDKSNYANPIARQYNKFINMWLNPTVDKEGSTLVANMNACEGRAAFFSNVNFIGSTLLMPLFSKGGAIDLGENFNKLDSAVRDRIMQEIAMKLVISTSGTTTSADYVGGVLVTLDTENIEHFDPDTHIKPIVVNSYDTDKNIYRDLLIADEGILSDNVDGNKKHILIKVKQNALADVLHFDQDFINIYDLDNEGVRSSFVKAAVDKYMEDSNLTAKALEDKERFFDGFAKFYGSRATKNDLVNVLTDVATENGLSDNVAKSLIRTVTSISSRNSTKELEQLNQLMLSKILNPIDVPEDNKQFAKIRDSFTYGISKESLPTELEEYLDKMHSYLSYQYSYEVNDAASALLRNDSSLYDKLSDDDKVSAVQLYLLRNRTGANLEYILRGQGLDYYDSIKEKIDKNLDLSYFDFDNTTGKLIIEKWKNADGSDTNPYNILYKGNSIMYDIESLYNEDSNDQKPYQIAFAYIPKEADENVSINPEYIKNRLSNNIVIKNILIREELEKADSYITQGYKYEESEGSFSSKKSAIKGNPNNFIVVNTLEDALRYIKSFCDDPTRTVSNILGMNNNKYDDLLVKEAIAKSSKPDSIDFLTNKNNLDVQRHMLNGAMYDESIRQSRSKAMDTIRSRLESSGIFTKTDNQNTSTHDAATDIQDQLILYSYLVSTKTNVADIYDGARTNLHKLGVDDEIIKQVLTRFKDNNYSGLSDSTKENLSNFRNNDRYKSGSALANLLRAYQGVEGKGRQQAASKERAEVLKGVIFQGSDQNLNVKDTWLKSVTDNNPATQYKMKNVLFNLMVLKTEGIKDGYTREVLINALDESLKTIKKALDVYEKEYDTIQNIKDEYDKNYVNTSTKIELLLTDDRFEEILTNVIAEETKNPDFQLAKPSNEALDNYFNKLITYKDSSTNEANETVFDVIKKRFTFTQPIADIDGLQDIKSDKTLNENNTRYKEDYNSLMRVYDKVFNCIDDTLNTLVSDPNIRDELKNSLIGNLSAPLGTDTKKAFIDKQELRKANKNKLAVPNKINDNAFNTIVDLLDADGGEFYTYHGAYEKAVEVEEFSKDFKSNFGVVYVGIERLKALYGDLANVSVGDTLYSIVKRQPGEGLTTHVMPIQVVEGGNIGMTRSTAKTFFNGDLDGDSYCVFHPFMDDKRNDAAQRYVKEIHNRYNLFGTDILDLFKAGLTTRGDSSKGINPQEIKEFTIHHKTLYKNILQAINEGRDADANKLYSKLQNKIKALGFDEEKTKYFEKLAGFETVKNKLSSSNIYIKDVISKKDRDIYRTYSINNQLRRTKGGRELSQPNDSELIGQVSKRAKNEYVNRFILPTVELSNDAISQLNHILSTMDIANVKDMLINKLQSLDTNGSKIAKDNVNAQLKVIQDADFIDGYFIQELIQNLQLNIFNGDKAQSTYSELVNAYLPEALEPYKQKVQALVDLVKRLPDDFKTNYKNVYDNFMNFDIANAYGPELLANAADIINAIGSYKTMTATWASAASDESGKELIKKLLKDEEIISKSYRGIGVVSPYTNSIITKQEDSDSTYSTVNLGLQKQYVVMFEDNSLSDSAYVTKNNQANIQNIRSIDLNTVAGSKEIANNMDYINDIIDKDVTYKDLVAHFRNIKHLTKIKPSEKYRVKAFKDGRLFLETQDIPLYNYVKDGFAKVANIHGKAGKFTLMPNTKYTIKPNSDIEPDLLINSIDMTKVSSDLILNDTGKTCDITLGNETKEYKIYEVQDFAVVDGRYKDDFKLDDQERFEDLISIVHGGKNASGYISMGSTFFKFNNGKVEFDAKGFNSLRDVLSRLNKPDLSDANAMHDVNFFRLTTVLNALMKVDKSKYNEALFTALDGDVNETPAQLLLRIYRAKDLGGEYGDYLVNNLIHYVQSNNLIDKVREQMYTEGSNSQRLSEAVWAEKTFNANKNYSQTYSELSPEMTFATKKQFSSDNARFTNMSKDNLLGARYIKTMGGMRDSNDGNFMSRVNLLKAISGEYFSGDLIARLVDNNLLNVEEFYAPNQIYNFKNLNAAEAEMIEGNYEESTPQGKTGTFGQTFTQYINKSDLNFVKAPIKSRGNLSEVQRALSPTDFRKLIKLNNDGTIQWRSTAIDSILRHMLPYFTNGSLEDIATIMSNDNYRITTSLGIPSITVGDEGLKMDVDTVKITDKSIKDYVAKSKELNVNPLQYQVSAAKAKEIRYNINESIRKGNGDVTATEILKGINTKVTDDENLKNYLINHIGEIKSADYTINTDSLDVFIDSKITDDDISYAAKLWGEDINDIEFKNSLFRSAGFKAKDGLDLPIGQNVIYFANNVKQTMSKVLTPSFKYLVGMIKTNESLSDDLNSYMTVKFYMDLYDTLSNNKDKHIRNVGQKKYNEMLKETKRCIAGKNVSDDKFKTEYDKVKEYMAETLKNNNVLNKAVQHAQKINDVLLQNVNKYDPYAMLSYYLSKDLNKNKGIHFETRKYVEAYKSMHDSNRQIMNTLANTQDASILTASIFDSDNGYINSVMNIAKRVATVECMNNFSQVLKTKGYMKNVEVYSTAHELLYEALSEKIKDNNLQLTENSGTRREYNMTCYNILKDKISAACPNIEFEDYTDINSYIKMYERVCYEYNEKVIKPENLGSRKALEDQLTQNRDTVNQEQLRAALDIADAYEIVASTLIGIIEENNPSQINKILVGIYDTIEKGNPKYNLVDSRGCSLKHYRQADGTYRYPVTMTGEIKDIIEESKLIHANVGDDKASSTDKIKAEYAKMMLTGDIYLMNSSLSEQLDKKFFTTYQPGTIGKVLQAARKYVTTFIMASPLDLIDRTINFTLNDIGALQGASISSLKYLMPSIATIKRYASNIDYVTEEAIQTDEYLQLLLRYMASTGQSPYQPTNILGEEVAKVNIPVIKEFLKANSTMLSEQQFFARFALFCDEVLSGKANGYKLDETKLGVAYHLKKGLDEMDPLTQNAGIYKNLYDIENGRFYTDEELDQMRKLDAAAIQVVAENIGIFGNMPYAANMLSRLGMMFTGFPLQGMRWGINRVQSLAYAVAHLGDPSMKAGRYILNNSASTLTAATILLALQLLFSQNTLDWIKKKIKGEETTDAEDKSAENILFRGGSIQLFKTWLAKEEVTNPGQSRGQDWFLWNNFVADFILNKDNSFMENFSKLFKQNVWGHTNVAIKDIVESMPGNTTLQTYNWFTPEDNFLENIGRKAVGYVIGSAQSTALFDSLKANAEDKDKSFVNKLYDGFAKAQINNATGIKEYKSNWKNYKKAFQLVNDYLSVTGYYDEYKGLYDSNDSNYSQYHKDLASELTGALKNGTSTSTFYNIIEKYLQKGASYKTIKNTLQGLSLRNRLLKLDSVDKLSDYFSDNELAVIKSALAYEDYMFPCVRSALQEYTDLYREYEAKKSKPYTKSLSSVLSHFYYNSPENSYENKYNSYNDKVNFYNNHIADNITRNIQVPTEVYNSMVKAMSSGISTDIYGNKTRQYSDGSSYKIKDTTNPLITGG